MKKYLLALLFFTQIFAEEKPLIVGTTSGYAPYVSLDKNGNYEGFDIDFAEQLSKKLGRKLVLKDCGSMPSLLLALHQKKIDVLIWGISITNERMKKMEMVYYQGEKTTEIPVLFWKKIPQGISSIEDLSKYTVSVEVGSFQESILKRYPTINTKQVEKITDAIMEIRFGKSDAALTDPSLVEILKAQYPDLQVIYLPLKPEEYSLGNGIAINKQQQELVDLVKKATQELITEGKVAELERKWSLK